MQVRAARPEDLGQILGLVQALAHHHGDPSRADLDTLRADLFGPGPWCHALVAARGDELLGYVAILRLARLQYGQRGIDLHHLFVAAPHRGQGVGRALVRGALELGARLGASYATVTATPDNTQAQRFYAGLGFADAPRFGTRFWTPIAQDRDSAPSPTAG